MRAVTLDASAAARRGRARAVVKRMSRRDGVERSRRRRAVNDEEMSTQRFETRAFDAEIERMCDRGLGDALEEVDARLVTAMRGESARASTSDGDGDAAAMKSASDRARTRGGGVGDVFASKGGGESVRGGA